MTFYCGSCDFTAETSDAQCPAHPEQELIEKDEKDKLTGAIAEAEKAASEGLRCTCTNRPDSYKTCSVHKNLCSSKRELSGYQTKCLTNKAPQKERIGTGVHAEQFYFGTKVYDPYIHRHFDAVVTANGQFYINNLRKVGNKEWEGKNEITDDFGLFYENAFALDALKYHWSTNETEFSITNFLEGKCSVVDGHSLYAELLQINKEFVYHTSENIHILITTYVIATYFIALFNEFGRLHNTGAPDSGKTTQGRAISLYAFNTMAIGDFTEAYFFRCVDCTCGSVIVDDVDDLPEDMKRAIRHIDKVGYKRDFARKGLIAQDRSGRALNFDYFCSFVKNGIDDIDPTTSTRNFVIAMAKKPRGMKLTKARKNTKPLQELRDRLYVFALQNWEQVLEYYQSIEVPKTLEGRQEEIVIPLLAVAKVIGDDIYDALLSYLPERAKKQKIAQEADCVFTLAIKAILKYRHPVEDAAVIEFRCGELADWMISQMELDDDIEKKREKSRLISMLGKEFKTHQAVFEKVQRSGNRSVYKIKQVAFLDFLDTRGILSLIPTDEIPEEWKGEIKKREALTRYMEGTEEKPLPPIPTPTTTTTTTTSTTLTTPTTPNSESVGVLGVVGVGRGIGGRCIIVPSQPSPEGDPEKTVVLTFESGQNGRNSPEKKENEVYP